MTVLGKTLVFLTFLAALGMGGLMIYLANSTPKWKDAYEDQLEFSKVQKARADVEQESRIKWVKEANKLKEQLDAALVEARNEKIKLQRDLYEKEEQRKKYEMQMNQANLALEQSKLEALRLQKELNFTLGIIEKREQSILALQEEIKGHIQTAQAAKNERDTAVARAQALFEQLKQAQIVVQELKKKLATPAGTQLANPSDINNPSFKNPPTVYVQGSIMSVEKDLIKISLGTDMGVGKDNTLEVYRLEPEPKYLGRILILNADFRHSIARLIRQPGVPVPTMLVGDIVATNLSQNLK
jgi:hypothetical protein